MKKIWRVSYWRQVRHRTGPVPAELRGVVGPVSSVISVGQGYTVAIETVLGASLQNIIVENEQVAKRAVGQQGSQGRRDHLLPRQAPSKGNRLRETGLADHTPALWPWKRIWSSAINAIRDVVDNLLGRIVVVEELDDAVRMAKGFRPPVPALSH